MRRVTLTAQTLVGLIVSVEIWYGGEGEGRGLREAHGENSSQDEFLRLAGFQTPENWYRLCPLFRR